MQFFDGGCMQVPDALMLQLARSIVKRPEPTSLLEDYGRKVICPACGKLGFGPYLKAHKSRGKVYSYPSIKHTSRRSPWCTITKEMLIRSGVTLTKEQLESYLSTVGSQAAVQAASSASGLPLVVPARTMEAGAPIVATAGKEPPIMRTIDDAVDQAQQLRRRGRPPKAHPAEVTEINALTNKNVVRTEDPIQEILATVNRFGGLCTGRELASKGISKEDLERAEKDGKIIHAVGAISKETIYAPAAEFQGVDAKKLPFFLESRFRSRKAQ